MCFFQLYFSVLFASFNYIFLGTYMFNKICMILYIHIDLFLDFFHLNFNHEHFFKF